MSLSVIVLALLSSCSSRIINSNSLDMTPTVRPFIADLEVSAEKVTGNFTTTYASNTREEVMIHNAVFHALNSVKADVLVGMQYQITTETDSKGNLTEKTVIVTGYPAFYRNIRPVPNNVFDVQELKNDTPYIVTEHDGNGDSKIYTIITTQTNNPVIDLKDADLETVVLTKDKKFGKRSKE